MIPSEQDQLDLIERDRKQREEELILALLLLSDEAEAATVAAYRRGDDPGAAVRDAFYIPDIGPSASTSLTQAYAGAYRSAVKVAGQIAGTKTTGWKAPTETDPAAKTFVDSIVAKVQAAITQGMTSEQAAEAIGQAFDAAGVTKEHPHTLDAVAATQINAGYQPGLLEGWMQSPSVTGLRFKIVDDGRNTRICLARKNVQLPKRHPWWKKNVAPLHFSCRSTVLPIFGSFVPTANPPTDPPPQPGFGLTPSFMLSRIPQPVFESFDLAADAGGVFRNIGGHTVFISGGMITGAKEVSEHLKGKTVADAHDIVAGEHEAKAAEHKQWAERFARARDGRTANKHSDIAKEHANTAIELRNSAKIMRGEIGPMTPLITHAYLSRIAAPELESLDLDRGVELTGGEWRTINGARVYIKDGVAIAGPKGLVGEKGTPAHLIGKSESEIASHGAAPEKKEGFHSIERDAAGAYKGGTAEHEARLKGLKIAPGYTHVHLAEDPTAKLQATYRDSKGRAQYKYSTEHSGQASADKFARAARFAKDVPGIREKIANDPSEEAAALRLIAATGLRVGGSSDTGAEKQAYGATTLESQHVTPSGNGGATLKFTGKKGVDITHEIADPDVAKEVLARAKSGGKLYNTTDAKTRDFLHKVAPGTDYKVKDFRTHVAATTAKEAMKSIPAPTDEKSLAAGQKKVAEVVAAKLGNTPAIAIKDYIPPEVFAPWHGKVSNLQQADLISKSAAAKGITPDEAAKQWIPKHAASFRTDYKTRHKVTGKASKLNEPAFLSRGSNGSQHAQSQVREQSRSAGDVRHGFVRPAIDRGGPKIGSGGSGSGGPRRRIEPPELESLASQDVHGIHFSRIPEPEWESDCAINLSSSSDDAGKHWITIEHEHVLVGGAGTVIDVHGQHLKTFKGKHVSEVYEHVAKNRDREAKYAHTSADTARKSGNRAEEERHAHIAKFHEDKAKELRGQANAAGHEPPTEEKAASSGIEYKNPTHEDLKGDSIHLWHGTTIEGAKKIAKSGKISEGDRGKNASADVSHADQYPEETGAEAIALVKARPKSLGVDTNDQIGDTVQEGLFPKSSRKSSEHFPYGHGSSSTLGEHSVSAVFDVRGAKEGYRDALQSGDFEKAKSLGVKIIHKAKATETETENPKELRKGAEAEKAKQSPTSDVAEKTATLHDKLAAAKSAREESQRKLSEARMGLDKTKAAHADAVQKNSEHAKTVSDLHQKIAAEQVKTQSAHEQIRKNLNLPSGSKINIPSAPANQSSSPDHAAEGAKHSKLAAAARKRGDQAGFEEHAGKAQEHFEAAKGGETSSRPTTHATTSPTPSAKPATGGKITDDQLLSEAHAMMQTHGINGGLPIHELRDRIAQKYGAEAASKDNFDRAIKRMRGGKLNTITAQDHALAGPAMIKGGVEGAGETFTHLKDVKHPQTGEIAKSSPRQRTQDELDQSQNASKSEWWNSLPGSPSNSSSPTLDQSQNASSVLGGKPGVANASDSTAHTAAIEKHVTSNLVGGASTKNDFRNSAQFGADKASYPPDVEHSLRQSVAAGHIEAIPREQYTTDARRDDKLMNINGKAIQDFRLTGKGRAALENSGNLSRFDRIDPPELESLSLDLSTDSHSHSFASTHVELPKDIASKVKALADSIPDDELDEDGREDNPHITTKYGLHFNSSAKLRGPLSKEMPAKFRMGRLRVFPVNESRNSDVLVADVHSPDLTRLHQAICATAPHTDTHPKYQPHATIAYLKPGMGAKYAGRNDLEGAEGIAHEVVHSDRDGNETRIPLGGTSRMTFSRIDPPVLESIV